MNWVFEEFRTRVEETDKYFDFITNVETNNSSVIAKMSSNSSLKEVYKIDIDLTRILKANSFLLIYNLVESTVLNGIFEIFNSIKSNEVSFVEISKEIRKVWLNIKLNHDKNIAKDSIVNQFLSLSEEIINFGVIEIEKRHIKFQGNLDASRIADLAKIYGIGNHPVFRIDTIGEAFNEIRIKRNSLAHGDLTFKECGKDYTIQQITEYKKHVIDYLYLVLKNIEDFISKKSYLGS